MSGWLLAVILAGCGAGRSGLMTEGLHASCPAAGCADGQECVTRASPEGETRTCEIACETDADCPEGTVCNLSPVVPDSIPWTCVTR